MLGVGPFHFLAPHLGLTLFLKVQATEDDEYVQEAWIFIYGFSSFGEERSMTWPRLGGGEHLEGK